jgi:hypothetical protein
VTLCFRDYIRVHSSCKPTPPPTMQANGTHLDSPRFPFFVLFILRFLFHLVPHAWRLTVMCSGCLFLVWKLFSPSGKYYSTQQHIFPFSFFQLIERSKCLIAVFFLSVAEWNLRLQAFFIGLHTGRIRADDPSIDEVEHRKEISRNDLMRLSVIRSNAMQSAFHDIMREFPKCIDIQGVPHDFRAEYQENVRDLRQAFQRKWGEMISNLNELKTSFSKIYHCSLLAMNPHSARANSNVITCEIAGRNDDIGGHQPDKPEDTHITQ